jgi:hypothetical protein
MKRLSSIAVWTIFLMGLAGHLRAADDVMVMPKQLLVLKPAIDSVAGTWVAAVRNAGNSDVNFSLPVLLPADASDFMPIEGLSADQIRLGNKGLEIEKPFSPGVTVVSVGFVLPARSGRAMMKLHSRADVGELTVMTPRGLLDVRSPELVETAPDVQDMQRYSVWTVNRMLLADQILDISIGGVPEGRSKLWLVGGLLGIVLVFGSWIFARRTEPQIKSAAIDELA